HAVLATVLDQFAADGLRGEPATGGEDARRLHPAPRRGRAVHRHRRLQFAPVVAGLPLPDGGLRARRRPAAPSSARPRPARRPHPRLDPSRPRLFCGQGTSLHAARVAAAWAGYPALAVESQDVALRTGVPPGAQVVVVSHSGGGFTPAVLRQARAAGATTFAICSDAAPADADHVIRT